MSSSNLLLSMVVGTSLSQLWGMVRPMQYLCMICVVQVMYPGEAMLFLECMIQIAGFDMFNTAELHSELFEFKQTTPVNDFFELMGTENKNFVLNSASILPFVALLIV